MAQKRKNLTAREKVAILRRHFLDKVPVSELCDKLSLQPTTFYRWQKTFFDKGAAAFEFDGRRARKRAEPDLLKARRSGAEAVNGYPFLTSKRLRP